MKKLFVILAIILSLVMVGNGYAESNQINAVSGMYSPIKSQYGTGIMWSNPLWLKSISMYGATAGDAVMVYNGIDGRPTGIEFELSIGANTSNSPTWDAAGAYFEKGLYVHCSVSTILVTAVFDY